MWAAMSDTACGLNTARATHIEVDDHHIRLELQTECDGLPSIGRLTDHIEARCSQSRPETTSKPAAARAALRPSR
jgi:hypothetical protein